MAKAETGVLDLRKAVPEEFDELTKAMLDMRNSSERYSKRYFWNMGRHVTYFKDADHKEKYGRGTIEKLADDIGYKKSTLYVYSGVYKAYDSDAAFARVLKRERVAASMLVALAWLPSDAERDQVERRIQGSTKKMTYRDVKTLIKKMLGKGQGVDGRTKDPVTLCMKLYEKIERQTGALINLLTEGVQLEGGLAKAHKAGKEIPKSVLKRRKEALSLASKATKALQKYTGFVETHEL